jgi:hypothetical protein
MHFSRSHQARALLPLLGFLLAGGVPPCLRAQPLIATGAEFPVNTYTDYDQSAPSVGMAADGDFVVVWSSVAQDGGGLYRAAFGRRFSSSGVALGVEFQINTYTASDQDDPQVAAQADGDFVVVWKSYQDGDYSGIFARRYDSGGVALGLEFQVNARTAGSQRDPIVATRDGGDFVVIWTTYSPIGGGYYEVDAYGRRFDSAGSSIGGDFLLSSSTTGYQADPTVDIAPDGHFVVVWSSEGQDGSEAGVFARRFTSGGAPQGTEFQVNVYTSLDQRDGAIAIRADGSFVITWNHDEQDGSDFGVSARRFGSAGTAIGGEFQVSTYTQMDQAFPVVAFDGDGNFVIVWQSFSQDGSQNGVFSRTFAPSGAALGPDLQVSTFTSFKQAQPAIASDGDGRFVVAWESGHVPDNDDEVFARLFTRSTLAVLDVDGNGVLDALADGLLVLRYRFGFTNATLTAGAVGPNCTRCNAAAIEPYLAGLGLTLDIDGNGQLEALSDGLLVLRYMFGFSGATLTNNAIGLSCARCDAGTIAPYLQELD